MNTTKEAVDAVRALLSQCDPDSDAIDVIAAALSAARQKRFEIDATSAGATLVPFVVPVWP